MEQFLNVQDWRERATAEQLASARTSRLVWAVLAVTGWAAFFAVLCAV